LEKKNKNIFLKTNGSTQVHTFNQKKFLLELQLKRSPSTIETLSCFYPVQKTEASKNRIRLLASKKKKKRETLDIYYISFPSASRHANERNKVDKRFEFLNPACNILRSTTISVNPTTQY